MQVLSVVKRLKPSHNAVSNNATLKTFSLNERSEVQVQAIFSRS